MTHTTTSSLDHDDGFTLIELAIALMVIGLLIGGVLKGQELIENARVTKLMRQIGDIKTATLIFQSTYNALPGDISNPASRIPNCTTSYCSITGNKNGILEPTAYGATSYETGAILEAISWEYDNSGSYPDRYNFWRHLERAGMISTISAPNTRPNGDNYEQFYPISPYGSFMVVGAGEYGTGVKNGIFIENPQSINSIAVPVKAAANIDRKLDDGKPRAGDIFPGRNGMSATSACVATVGSEIIYAETASAGGCSLIILLGT